jgi:YidC/Oxa1 family membrane protein insertase
MDTKRLILAIGLSMVVILVYQQFFMPKKKPVTPQQQTAVNQLEQKAADAKKTEGVTTPATAEEQKTESGAPGFLSKKNDVTEAAPVDQEVIAENLADNEEKEIVVETDLYRAVFTNKGAGLKSFVLHKYNDDKGNKMELISNLVNDTIAGIKFYPFYFPPFNHVKHSEIYREINGKNFRYTGSRNINLTGGEQENSKTTELTFEYADVEKNIKVVKRFLLSSGNYVMDVDCKVYIEGRPVDAPIIFGPGLENNSSENRIMQGDLRIASYNGEDVADRVFKGIETQKDERDEKFEMAVGSITNRPYWAAYDTNYFGVIFNKPGNVEYTIFRKHVMVKDDEGKEVPGIKNYNYVLVSNPKQVYIGPKEEKRLESLAKSHGFIEAEQTVNYGWAIFGGIARIMLKGIIFIYGFIPNYGWALVIFTIFIKLLLFPLTYASSVSMAKMQSLQPKIKAIKKKYKNQKDPEQRKAMNMETMELYKREKVNPAGGCLPLLLQMPILFAFFRLLPISINFRHEAWMLWITDLSIKDPFYVLPILMGATQIVVSKMSPTTADSNQKKLMYFMPAVMVFLFMNYSAGLNLYWFISNLLQVGQQYYINQKIFKEKKEEERERRAMKRKKGGKTK